jgi:hypothetical protein
MFLDLNGYYRRQPEPPPQNPPRRTLTVREQKVMIWVICFNLALLVVAPIGGATVIHAAIAALFR